MSCVPPNSFLIAKHRKFLDRCLKVLPAAYSSLDANRLTLLFFALSSLDILDELERAIGEEERRKLIGWIYSLQLTGQSGTRELFAD
uniref:Prenyltransferase alpha-alpha toroid domain-containing protein n=1 Tax=Plectus sambesii TaxID=2011161 RepID=A0A914W171_9BILA